MHDRDQIEVCRLELLSCVGVPDEERAEAQRLTVDLRLFPVRDFTALGDDIVNTVDYFALTRRVRRLASDRPRKLIETLANDIAECVLSEFAVARVEVELRKYILADTEYVAVRVSRGA
ncbi:MAG: dihydroneopterin aldolase [Verrucomicrobiota bacterium]